MFSFLSETLEEGITDLYKSISEVAQEAVSEATKEDVNTHLDNASAMVLSFLTDVGEAIKETWEEETEYILKQTELEKSYLDGDDEEKKAPAPWDDLDPIVDTKLRREITLRLLEIAKATRNIFLVPPEQLDGFTFSLEDYAEIARSALDGDPLLDKLRFDLVPKEITEEEFWKHYFLRVNIIRIAYSLPPILLSEHRKRDNDDIEALSDDIVETTRTESEPKVVSDPETMTTTNTNVEVGIEQIAPAPITNTTAAIEPERQEREIIVPVAQAVEHANDEVRVLELDLASEFYLEYNEKGIYSFETSSDVSEETNWEGALEWDADTDGKDAVMGDEGDTFELDLDEIGTWVDKL